MGGCALTWVQGTELGFSARTLSTLNLWAIFPTPIMPFSTLRPWSDLSPRVSPTQLLFLPLSSASLSPQTSSLTYLAPLLQISHSNSSVPSARVIFPKHFNWAVLLLWKEKHKTYRKRNAPLPGSSTLWTGCLYNCPPTVNFFQANLPSPFLKSHLVEFKLHKGEERAEVLPLALRPFSTSTYWLC